MERVLIVGCPGSGKSTFARRLQSKLGLPLFYLDQFFWREDRTMVDQEVFLDRLDQALQEPTWIIDGNYLSSLDQRLAACDTVFFLDYPLEVCLAGVANRQGHIRPDLPWIEETIDPEFISYIRRFPQDRRPILIQKLKNLNQAKSVYTFTYRGQADKFLHDLPDNGPLKEGE